MNTFPEINNILIVDDEELNLECMEVMLGSKGYSTITAQSGEQAINHVQEREDIAMIFMDISMHPMSGFQTFDKIREINPDIPIIAQTAYALGDEMEKIKNYGFDQFIAKPINLDEMVRLIKELTS